VEMVDHSPRRADSRSGAQRGRPSATHQRGEPSRWKREAKVQHAGRLSKALITPSKWP
jgi:hypothetical protein